MGYDEFKQLICCPSTTNSNRFVTPLCFQMPNQASFRQIARTGRDLNPAADLRKIFEINTKELV
jgi:hypothetical protein